MRGLGAWNDAGSGFKPSTASNAGLLDSCPMGRPCHRGCPGDCLPAVPCSLPTKGNKYQSFASPHHIARIMRLRCVMAPSAGAGRSHACQYSSLPQTLHPPQQRGLAARLRTAKTLYSNEYTEAAAQGQPSIEAGVQMDR
jgi:hypothetical protein